MATFITSWVGEIEWKTLNKKVGQKHETPKIIEYQIALQERPGLLVERLARLIYTSWYYKRETWWTKLKNSESVMILVVR
jgi:hypothetical protein